jgi:peptide chain release factor subunit 1
MTPTDLHTQLDRLASFEAGPVPVVSLYLNTQAGQHGRDQFKPFVRKELGERIKTFPASSPERLSLEKDVERINTYLDGIEPSLNGLAIFACSGSDFFEAMPLAAPIAEHRLYVASEPHLYPLAQLADQFPRYAVLVADTNSARLFVVAGNAIERTTEVEGVKTRRHKMGGWSQARYQRHVENFHLHHTKEVVDALTRLVRAEQIDAVILAGDDVILPLLKDQLSKDIAERVVEDMKLDIRTPPHEILEATMDVMRARDVQGDRERVDELLGAYRGNGLATVGVEGTKRALEMGQVEELLVSATGRPDNEQRADPLVAKAHQTGARVRFIEDATLLAAAGGVGAFLRFRI